LESYRSIRANVGPDFPVLVKLNGSDNLTGGLALDDAVHAARALDAEGIDAIEVSSGTSASGGETPVRQHIDIPAQEAYNLALAKRIRSAVTCPVMVVGGIRSYEVSAGIIRRDEAEYVALARPLIREPDLPRRWQKGDETHARCISCNGCFKPGIKQGGIFCVIDAIEREAKGASL
jgi:2,4-dienoyl-CoA reductase-like NADH-dependent reductase (Old Yellow Enzyme family)